MAEAGEPEAAPVLLEDGDICGDGSIVKEILKAGEGDKPLDGADVTVHYVGTLLDGTEFDSSRGRGDPFKFKIGQGSVIKGWDEGVATMKVGELARLTIKPEKGYGASAQGKIPANATLVFEVELLRWSNLEDVSPQKDGGIMKQLRTKGDGFAKPDTLTKVVVKVTVKDAAGAATLYEAPEPVAATVGDGELPPALEVCVSTMKPEETASFKLEPHCAFGAEGSADYSVPPNAAITLDLELVSMDKPKDPWDYDGQDKLDALDAVRTEGNECFKAGQYAKAVRRYERALKFADSEYKLDDAQKAVQKTKKVLVLLNMAMCLIKQKQFREARDKCSDALAIEPDNVKGLYRRATALLESQDFDEALADLKHLLGKDEGNKAAKVLKNKVVRAKAAYAKKEQAKYAGMFDRMAAAAPAEPTPAPAPEAEAEAEAEAEPEAEADKPAESAVAAAAPDAASGTDSSKAAPAAQLEDGAKLKQTSSL